MLNFKKTEILLCIFIILLVSGTYLIKNPSIFPKLFFIDSRATQQTISLSLTIGASDEEVINSTTGTIKPSDAMIKETVEKIEDLPLNSEIKIRVHTSSLPKGFVRPSTTIISQVFNYINMTLNTTLSGTATIYFNITQADLGTIDPDDIRLYRYDTSWTELTTTVIDGVSDPASFSAETDSFSPFLIGEKAEGAAVITPPLGGPISKGGLKLGLEKPVPRPKPAKLIIPTAKKIIEKIIKLPAHLLKYEVNYKAIYITTAFLIVIILELIYDHISHKKRLKS